MKTIESEIGGYRSAPDMHTSLGAMASADESEIASFYTGKCIFITGATGFVGKVRLISIIQSKSKFWVWHYISIIFFIK